MIELMNVSKTYGPVQALAPASLHVRKGEFVSILGPSGSGKSTLLALIAGSIPVSGGRISIGGRDVTWAPSRERGIGMVFQNYALMPHMTVFNNVAYPLKLRRMDRQTIATKVSAALAKVGLQHVEGRKPSQLSGGQQQRVGIARCLVYEPDIILMDEPLGALDKNMRGEMQTEISRIHNELGSTIIYVTHDQEEAMNLSDRICLMNEGKVVQIASPQDSYSKPINRFAAEFLGESTILEWDVLRPHVNASALAAMQPAEADCVLVRPERIRITRDRSPDHDVSLAGTVIATKFAGAHWQVTVGSGSGSSIKSVYSVGSGEPNPALGDQVHANWNLSDMHSIRKD